MKSLDDVALPFELTPEQISMKPKPKPKKTGGAKAQAEGKSTEKALKKTHDSYEASNRAYVAQVSAKFQVETFGTNGQAIGRLSKGPVDFLGTWNYGTEVGRPIAFDAKATASKTSFPLSNVSSSQILFLKKWMKAGGMGFLVLHFYELGRWFVVSGELAVAAYYDADRDLGPKSLSLDWLDKHGKEITVRKGGVVDYLLALSLMR